jgi:hypothetical protein
MPACVGDLFPVVPGGYPPNTHKVSRDLKKKTMAVFMPCKAWPIKLHATLDLSPVKCTVKPKAAGFTRIRVCEEPNVGMTQVKLAAKDFTECKDQFFISLKFSLDTCPVSQEKIQKIWKYPPITWKKWGEFCEQP